VVQTKFLILHFNIV